VDPVATGWKGIPNLDFRIKDNLLFQGAINSPEMKAVLAQLPRNK